MITDVAKGELRTSHPDAPLTELHNRLDEDGYLFFPGLLDLKAVVAVRQAVLTVLDDCGWLDGDDEHGARPSSLARPERPEADPGFFEAYRAIQRLEPFHELAHHAELVSVMERLLGTPLLVHPRKVARVGLPRDEMIVASHQDFRFNQGSPDVLTAWVPLGDCPDELGGLRVLPVSHRRGLLPVRRNDRVGGLEVSDPIDEAEGWQTTSFRCGDALVFHSLTVHAAKPNNTDRIRLSVDYRYQLATEPVTESSLLPHFYPRVPGHDELTKGWTSRLAVATPDELNVVPKFDRVDGPDGPIVSRLVNLTPAAT